MNRTYYLYAITNILNGKKYIGQTIDVTRRWITHTTLSKPIMYIDRAIKKYGKENFIFEIVETVSAQEEANALEAKLINDFNSIDKEYGYNVKPGGKVATGWHHDEITKKKISDSEKGKIVKPETKIKMSVSQSRRVRKPEEFSKMIETKRS